MQNNYTALYEYICDNPDYHKKSIIRISSAVPVVPVLSPLLSLLLLKPDNFWQFWKAVVENVYKD
jgi:hypothetical protein